MWTAPYSYIPPPLAANRPPCWRLHVRALRGAPGWGGASAVLCGAPTSDQVPGDLSVQVKSLGTWVFKSSPSGPECASQVPWDLSVHAGADLLNLLAARTTTSGTQHLLTLLKTFPHVHKHFSNSCWIRNTLWTKCTCNSFSGCLGGWQRDWRVKQSV